MRRWASWRIGLQPPPRAAVDPAQLKTCLPDFWIFRIVEGENDLVCTLAGESIREAWGHSIIGGRPIDLWGPADGNVVRSRLLHAARAPALIQGRTGIIPKTGTGKLAQRLMLPLADDDGAPYGVMGMTLYTFNRHLERDLPVPVPLYTTVYPCAHLPLDPPPPEAA